VRCQNWFGSELKVDTFFVQLKGLLVCKNDILTARTLLTLNVMNGFVNTIHRNIF